MNNKQLLIKQSYTEDYTLIIDSDMMAVNAKMQSKTQIRWNLNILKVSDTEVELKLILLDHILLESNNPLIKEIANLTKAFSRLYNELHLKIDQQGKILDVLNMDIILSKWKQTKAEMEKIAEHTPDIKNAIILHDSIFQDKAKLTQGIQASEFFMLHFNYVYGNDLPYDTKDISKPNFFNSANVQWSCFVNPMQELPTDAVSVSVNIDMSPFMPLGIGFYNRAYSQFANQIDITKLNTRLKETGTYKINPQTGKLLEARLYREEVADEKQLFTKIKYTLMSEPVYKEFIKDKTTQNTDATRNVFLAQDTPRRKIYKIANQAEGYVTIYKYQAVNSQPLEELKNDEEITMIEYHKADWCLVQSKKGTKGYIHDNDLKPIISEEVKEQAPHKRTISFLADD